MEQRILTARVQMAIWSVQQYAPHTFVAIDGKDRTWDEILSSLGELQTVDNPELIGHVRFLIDHMTANREIV